MTTERYADEQGRVRDVRVTPDAKAPLQVARVVSMSPVVVEVLATGRQAQLFKRLQSLDVAQVDVGTLLLVCRVEQGLIAVGEVV